MGFDLGSILSAILGGSAQANQAAIDWANLQFQKENAQRQYDLATSSRQDAFGDTTGYDQALKKWTTKLTPTQSQISRAGQREQLASLTEDAARNRNKARRQETRALAATEDYNNAERGYRYDQPIGEDAIRGELDRLMGSARSQAAGQGAAAMARQAVRLGRGGDVEKIMKASQDALGGQTVDSIIKARQQALNEAGVRESQHQSKYLVPMRQFGQTMDAIGDSPLRFSDINGPTNATQGQMISQAIGALVNGGSAIGNAYNELGNTMGKYPNLSGALSLSLGGSGSGSGSDTLAGGTSFDMGDNGGINMQQLAALFRQAQDGYGSTTVSGGSF